MNLLAFDTSTDTLSIAVARGPDQWQYRGPGAAQSSATLIPAIQQLLAQAELGLEQLDAIVFGRGPGSFTGLRTACAIAQGLALGAGAGRGLPVLPIDTLMAVAEEARQEHGCTQIVATLDARMNEVYHGLYQWQDDGLWQTPADFGLCAPEAVPAPDGWTVAGNAQAAYGARLAAQAPHVQAWPTATALLRLAPALLAAGAGVPADQALPRYVRDKVAKTTAEREAERAAPQP